MKAVQVSIDPPLLEQLDADDEVRRVGRSAFLRALVRRYLDEKRAKAIDDQYQAGYAELENGEAPLGTEFEEWDEMGEWPDE